MNSFEAARAALRTPRETPAAPEPSEGMTGRRVSLLLLAGLVTLLAVASVVLGRGGSAPSAPAPAAAAAPTAAAPVVADPAAGIPVSGPPASWRVWESGITRTALPGVAGAGPADPARSAGFAHTATGALVAAANLMPQLWFATDIPAWNDLADRAVIWGDGARSDLERRRAAAIADAPPAVQPLAVAGFRYIYFRGDEAQLRLWLRGPASTLGMNVRLLWIDGDWKVAWDEQAANIRVLQASESYVPWAAAS